MTDFAIDFRLTARCVGCDRDVPDWEERTRSTGKPSAKVEGPDGAGYLAESWKPCECGATRLRVSFRVG